jgi:hypothetical protein
MISDLQPDPDSLDPTTREVKTIAMVGAPSNCAATATGSVMTRFSF